MSSLYAQYLREKSTDHIYEHEFGFATFRYLNDGNSVYIIDIYVVPEMRRQGYAFDLVDKIVKIAKENGCTELLGTIAVNSTYSSISLKGHLSYGLDIISAADNVIILKKDI
jgi:GNAT superfamily N-acetyltransferase